MNGIARAERTITPATAVFVAVMCLIAGFTIGIAIPDLRTVEQQVRAMTPGELQMEVDIHRMCMQSASRTGCKMQVADFRFYHEVTDEIARRAIAKDSAEADSDTQT